MRCGAAAGAANVPGGLLGQGQLPAPLRRPGAVSLSRALGRSLQGVRRPTRTGGRSSDSCVAALALSAVAAGIKANPRRRPIVPGKVAPVFQVPANIARPPYISGASASSSGMYNNSHEWAYDERNPFRIEIKDASAIEGMRAACALAREALEVGGRQVVPGNTTAAVDAAVYDFTIARGAYPSPLMYMNFPKAVCTSVNDTIVHGIPDDRPLEQGDIVNIDVTVYLDGFHGDTSSMFWAGRPDRDARSLCEATRRAMTKGIRVCGPGVDFREVGKAIGGFAAEAGYYIPEYMYGHGIGSYFHGAPHIPQVATSEDQGLMKPGMTFTIEPVLIEHLDKTYEVLPDKWTMRTKTGAWSAQFEHTILITDSGHEVLTGPTIDYQALCAELNNEPPPPPKQPEVKKKKKTRSAGFS